MFKVTLDYLASLSPFGGKRGAEEKRVRVIYIARVVCNEAESQNQLLNIKLDPVDRWHCQCLFLTPLTLCFVILNKLIFFTSNFLSLFSSLIQMECTLIMFTSPAFKPLPISGEGKSSYVLMGWPLNKVIHLSVVCDSAQNDFRNFSFQVVSLASNG